MRQAGATLKDLFMDGKAKTQRLQNFTQVTQLVKGIRVGCRPWMVNFLKFTDKEEFEPQ